MRKIILLLTFFFCVFETSYAQICDRLLNDGKAELSAGRFAEAKRYFIRGQNTSECKNIDWQILINECDDKEKAAQKKQQPIVIIVPSQPTITPCDILLKQGQEKFDAKNYEEAKTFFTSASEQGCSAANEWLKKIKDIQCEVDMYNGEFYYNRGEYALALTYFQFAANNGCSGAEVGIQRCKTHIAKIAIPLNFSEIRRVINLNVGSNTTQSFENGDYKGEILRTQRNGKGIYIWSNGSVYIGEFLNELQSGTGIYIVQDGGYIIPNCPDCAFYVGGWENGKKKGSGNCYDETGKLLYSGNFSNNTPIDNYPSSNIDSSYKFEIINDTNGNKYCGETKNGRSNGLGIEIDNSGNIKFGNWREGQLNGSYIYFSKNGGFEKLNL